MLLIRSPWKILFYVGASLLLAACASRCSTGEQSQSWDERYKAMDIPSTEPRTVEQAIADFRVPEGIAVSLIAAEPLIGDPVAMEWDEYGRLYVVEMRGFMRDSHGLGETEPLGQVVRLSDRDGDGEMDHRELFLDKLVNPRAIAVINEGIVIAEPPNLWLCSMPSKDSLCTDKSVLGAYGSANPDDIEHTENRLLPALNGWLYSGKSEQKLRVRNGKLESQPTGYRGQWGLSQDATGRIMSNNNSNLLSADFFPARYYQGFRYKSLGPDPDVGMTERLIDDQQVYSVRVNPGVNRADGEGVLRDDGRLNAATAVSGLQYYQGSQLPAQWNGHVFVPEPGGNLVVQLAIQDDDVGLKAEHITYADEQWGRRDFLASTDERFRPVDARLGPDGALYIIDMYRGIIQHRQFITDLLRTQSEQRGLVAPIGMGRIYRIASTEAQPAAESDFSSVDGLMAALAHVDPWPRTTAARLLLKPEYRLRLSTLNIDGLPETSQPLALWLKHNAGVLSASELMSALNVGGATRINAMQLAPDYLSLAQWLEWQGGETLTTLERIHLLASLAHWPESMEARQLALAITKQHHDSPYFRRVYLSGVPANASAELTDWLQDQSLGKGEGVAKMIMGLGMTAYLDARSDVGSAQASPAAEDFFAWLTNDMAKWPTWKQTALLNGIALATRAENFVPVQLAAAPGFMAAGVMPDEKVLQKSLNAAHAAFSWPGDDFVVGLEALTAEQKQLREKGQLLYSQCAACHQENGRGVTGLAPTLADSQWVTGPVEWLTRIVLHGVSGPIEVAGEEWNLIMPGHAKMPGFDDPAIAGLLTHIRRSWGNKAGAVSVEQVAAVRELTSERQTPWTVAELKSVEVESPYSQYAGRYKIPFMPMSMDVIAHADHIRLESPQGGVDVVPDPTGVFTVPEMGASFFFEKQDNGDMVMKFTRGKDKIDMKRKD